MIPQPHETVTKPNKTMTTCINNNYPPMDMDQPPPHPLSTLPVGPLVSCVIVATSAACVQVERVFVGAPIVHRYLIALPCSIHH